MKLLTVFFLLSAYVVAYSGTVTLKVSGSSGLKGTAIVFNEMQNDGSKVSRMEMTLTDPKGQSVMIVQETIYQKSGVPKQKSQTTTIEGVPTYTIVAIFERGVVRLQAVMYGKSSETTIPVPTDLTIAEKFEFWFCRDKIPLKGQNTFYRFDLSTLKFERTKSIYQGRRSIMVGQRVRTANLVQVGDSKIYLDDRGDPIRIVSPGVLMERIK